MSIFIKDIDMPTEYGICITILPDGRVTGEFSEMVIGHAVDGETVMSCGKKDEKHGKWVKLNDDDSAYRCSVCGEISCCKSIYCGDCGAKMVNRDG